MNPNIANLLDYPFDRLRELKSGIRHPTNLKHISLALGEPRHTPPAFILDAVGDHLHLANQYPPISGTIELRQAIVSWLERRYKLSPCLLDPDKHVLAANGTREALFAVVQALVDNTKGEQPQVCIPNPFYAIYEGAALLAGARVVYLGCPEHTDFLPELIPNGDSASEVEWAKCQLLFLCSPNNPTGAVIPESYYRAALELSDRYGFVLASDECYSEIYFDDARPPVGLLEVCQNIGRTDFRNCLVFNSLSKRSSVPGLRSGFVAGDSAIIKELSRYRSYHGCAIPLPIQAASALAWKDEEHVMENRRLYKEKLEAVHQVLSPVLSYSLPQASFFLWAKTPTADPQFTQELFSSQNVTVLPGSYLSRTVKSSTGVNMGSPGDKRVRIALVAEKSECIEAAERIYSFLAR